MSEKNGILKRKNRFHRWLAMALTVALLVGQSHAIVLAEEAAGDASQTEISSEETGEDTVGDSNVGDADNGLEEGAQKPEDGEEPEDGEKTEEPQDGEDTLEDDEENAEEVVNPDKEKSEEETVSENALGEEETVSENALDEEMDVALLSADEGVETLAVGEEFEDINGIKYRVTDDDQVEVIGHKDETAVSGDLIIPKTVDNGNVTYRVTGIGDRAFIGCENLKNIDMPDSVIRIGEGAFTSCVNLVNAEIPKNVTSIGKQAFSGCQKLESAAILPEGLTIIEDAVFSSCFSLTSVTIPDGVTSIGMSAFSGTKLTSVDIPESVTSIGVYAFYGCQLITSVEIPRGVSIIEEHAFQGCYSLTSVTIPEKIKKIEVGAFKYCENLRELRIVVSSDEIFQFPKVEHYSDTFRQIPSDRYILFVDGKGKALTGQDFIDKKKIFTEAAKTGSGAHSDTWYGWYLREPTMVTVNVQKDDTPWTDHGRCFMLLSEGGDTPIDLSEAVSAGKYYIYDVTGIADTDVLTKGANTGVTATVTNVDVSATVEYYTVTFCDYDDVAGEQAYGEETEWKPQTVLKTVGRVAEPATNPAKEGYTFDKWVTAPGGDEAFSFGTTAVTEATKIYAKWTQNPASTYTVTINVNKDGQTWDNHEKTFALTKDDGATFETDLDMVEKAEEPYTIYDVTGLSADEFQTKGVNTGVTVTVTDADVTATVKYYTATFYDGTEAYQPETPQEPQIILSGQRVAKPADPVKDEQQFAGWKTENGGSTPYDFTAAVTNTTSIYASWVEKTAEQFRITASAAEGGTIDPVGDIAVTKGGEQTFTITPNEGKKIKAVTVDGSDVTAELADALTRAQTEARYYTFTNVTQNHTIHADFEDNSGDDNPGGGDDDPDGGDDNPGGGGSGGGDDNPGGGGSGGGGDNPGDEGGTENAQTVVAVKTAAPQTETKQSAASNEKEPKTDDATHMEAYATIAMIAGLSYLLLCFMEEGRGMTEREKEVFVAAFIRWGKKGGAFRRGCAIVAIFCLLAYYHSIGKRVGGIAADGRYLGQTS